VFRALPTLLMEIRLLDHVIVGHEGRYSFAKTGLI
jgi:DNA repair protein RadC